MPKPIYKGQSAGSGGPASSAQADIAPAEVASVYGLGGQFRLLTLPDVEYDTGKISSVYDRDASLVPRAMPAFKRDMSSAPQRKFKAGIGERPVTMLPTTNLEKVEPPPGMSYPENIHGTCPNFLKARQLAMKEYPTGMTKEFIPTCQGTLHGLAGTQTLSRTVWIIGSVS